MAKQSRTQKVPTVTIGLTVYNEQGNIREIVRSVLGQTDRNFTLERIIVITDGCTDRTVDLVRGMKDERIRLVAGENRQGKPRRINQMFKMSTSDIFVLLDADIALSSPRTLSYLIEPFINNEKVQLTSGHGKSNTPMSFVQRVAQTDHLIWSLCKFHPDSPELLLCDGSLRAFGKKLYSTLRFSDFSADEAYSYLVCVSMHYDFVFTPKAYFYYTLPSTFSDYIKQIRRYILSPDIQTKLFDPKLIETHFHVSYQIKAQAFFKTILKRPMETFAYILSSLTARVLNIFGSNATSIWDILSTTKATQKIGKRKIVISNYDDLKNPYYGGGGAVVLHDVCKKLAKNFDITILTGNYPHAENKVIDGVAYRRIGLNFVGPHLGQLLFHAFLIYYVLRLDYDVWIENFTPPFSTSFLQVFTTKPVIGLTHMLSAKDMVRKYHIPFHHVESKGLKTYKTIITINKMDETYIRTINPTAQITTIPNGITIEKKRKAGDKKHILFIGRIEVDQKGMDLLLKAYAALHTTIPLIIAGDGNQKEIARLTSLIKKHDLSNQVSLVGRVQGEQKAKLFKDAYCITVSSRFETFPLVALEAMSYQTPLVTFDIPGLSWIPQDCRYVARTFHADEFSAHIQAVLTKSKEKQSKIQRAYRFVKKYTLTETAKKYKSVINSVLT